MIKREPAATLEASTFDRMSQPIFKAIILGEPVPQARAKANVIWPSNDGMPQLLEFFKAKTWVNFYTPAKSTAYRDHIKVELTRLGLPELILDQPMVMSLKAYKTRPKSNKLPWFTTRPDLDNYMKQVKDAMSGLVYRDDSVIVGYHNTWKLYTKDNPRIEITLYDAFLWMERGEDRG